ncbi:Hypothetical protein, putative [Bodo saltans]|uniref:Uncharacterized protein n=1 Tax=Bodo saltans TaxID=75058 RepID=A0A0S4IQ53_BODSA|nr:Hypothetical protein, putative [Bodo saltans]|eukprot:CUF19995.1 Hypothetical protein, putative [Bodo saltans]
MGNHNTRETADTSRQAAARAAAELERTQRRAEEERERARLAELERLRRVEAATTERVNEELLKHRQNALREFAKNAHGFMILPIFYNMWTRHHAQGCLAVAMGVLLRISTVPANVAPKHIGEKAGLCMFALGCEIIGDLFADVWPGASNLLHFCGAVFEVLLVCYYAQ